MSLPPQLSLPTHHACLDKFDPVSCSLVTTLVSRLPNKSSSCDPLPCRFLKSCIDILAPFLTNLFNRSLSFGVFPALWKHATVFPILKKGKSNSQDASSYRPISNLPLLSKLLERIVSVQIRSYLKSNQLLPPLQSAYRPNHSTETSLLKLSSDVLHLLDNGKMCLLSFLDMSSAFDTVDHQTLLQKLHTSITVS